MSSWLKCKGARMRWTTGREMRGYGPGAEHLGKDGKVDIAGDKLRSIKTVSPKPKGGYVIDRYICLRLRSEQESTSTQIVSRYRYSKSG